VVPQRGGARSGRGVVIPCNEPQGSSQSPESARAEVHDMANSRAVPLDDGGRVDGANLVTFLLLTAAMYFGSSKPFIGLLSVCHASSVSGALALLCALATCSSGCGSARARSSASGKCRMIYLRRSPRL
jgi:hypothetical protein